MLMPKLTVDQVASLCPGYSAIQELDAGGYKTVYTAKNAGVNEVIKVIAIPNRDGSEVNERLRDECIGRVAREVEILSRCQTPLMVKPAGLALRHEQVADQDFVLYSEEYLPGDDLWKILRRATDRPDESEAKLLMRSLLECIKELWGMGYVHRDIKPKNIIKLDNPDRPFVLLDLGIAFSVAETGLTYHAEMRDPPATYRYLAPEMANLNFRDNLDYRSDLYTSALTAFEYATGQHPIANDNDDPVRTVTRAIRQHPKSLGDLRGDYSPQFVNLIDQLLKKKPALRPANLQQIHRILED